MKKNDRGILGTALRLWVIVILLAAVTVLALAACQSTPTPSPTLTPTPSPTATPTPTAMPTLQNQLLQELLDTRATATATAPTPTPTHIATERTALVALYQATDGPNWSNNSNWLSDRPLGEWHGVTTDGNGRVTGLDLHSNELSGPLPVELGRLSNLQILWLSDNELSGPLPRELGRLSNLISLELSGNQLSGAIPAELGSLTNLIGLGFSNNQLRGAIPAELSSLSNLMILSLYDNELSGPLPRELGRLSNLQILDIRSNPTLSGPLPRSLTGLTSLTILSLDGTELCTPADDEFQRWLQGVENTFGVVNCMRPAGPEKPTIRLADNQYESLWINNAVFDFIAQNGYGYPVEHVETTTPVAQAFLADGEIDIWIELWIANIIDWYNEETSNGNIEDLLDPPIYEGRPQFFMIPKWVADEHDIRTIDDMKRPEVVALFPDPEDSSKGVFVNCPIGWQCAEINRAKLQAYGLSDLYNTQSGDTDAALDTALAGAQMRNEPVFGYYWAPTALMGKYEWSVIEEPPYTEACWEEVIKGRDDASYAPTEACAYEDNPIGKGINSSLREKAPEIVEMLEKMDLGVEAMNKTAAWASENDIQGDWEKAAIYFLENYEDKWTTWMPSENADKVKEALAEMS